MKYFKEGLRSIVGATVEAISNVIGEIVGFTIASAILLASGALIVLGVRILFRLAGL